MIGDLLEKKLKDLADERILIVMDDGLAFLGELEQFDSNTLILKDVYQGPAKEIDWKKGPEEEGKGEEEKKIGYIDWINVNLKEVYIRTDHVLRIWHWTVEKEVEEDSETKDKGQTPVYSKNKGFTDERAASLGDIPETFPRNR